MNEERNARYWRRVQRVTGGLLLLWLLATLGGTWFARDLAAVSLFGFPLSFWLASQGALVLYIGIIAGYALLMDRIERRLADEASAAASQNGAPR